MRSKQFPALPEFFSQQFTEMSRVRHAGCALLITMSKKILIVEDEHDLIKLIKYNLEKESFRVNYTSDGSLVMAEMRRDPPDLVILDLMLPGLDGLEVCRQIRRHDKYAATPVLMLT